MAHFTPIVEDAVLALLDTMPLDKNTKPRAYALIHRILHQVRREPGKERGRDLLRGDVLIGVEELGEACGLSRQNMRTLLGPNYLGKSFLTPMPSGSFGRFFLTVGTGHQVSAGGASVVGGERSWSTVPTPCPRGIGWFSDCSSATRVSQRRII